MTPSASSHMSFYGGTPDPTKFVGQPVVQTYPSPPPQAMQQQNPMPYEASSSPIQQQPPIQQGFYPGPTSPQVQQDPALSPSQSDYHRLSQQSFATVQTQPAQQLPQVPPTVHEAGSNTGYWTTPPGPGQPQ